MIRMFFTSFALSLSLTLAVECILAYIFGIRKKGMLLVVLVNVLTNPIVVLFFNLIWFYNHHRVPWYIILPAEAAAVLTEGLIYSKKLNYHKVNPFFLSLILNTASYISGLLL